MELKTYTAEHRGSLKECLETEKPIEYRNFLYLIATTIYEYYGYDNRIKAHRYILKNMEKNIGLPTWLHYYAKKEDKPNL